MRKLREARHPRKNILFLRLRILNISAPPAQGGNAAPDRHPQALSADHADARAWPPGRTRVSTEPTTSGIQKVSLLFREEYGFYRLDTYLDGHYM